MKLLLDKKVPAEYDRAPFVEIIRAICNQSNLHAEGRLVARHQAQSVVPGSSVAAGIGDIVWDLNCTVRSGTVGAGVGNYVRLGWVCTTADINNPIWQEMRIPTG